MSNRRKFLSIASSTSLAISLPGVVPTMLRQAAAAADPSSERVLVVVQLSGGNDGLNSIVPFRNDVYQKSRPTLKVATNDVIQINEDCGFHPALRGLQDLLQKNQLAVVQGVGYPNPNRSHFESMDIWHTCRRKNETRSTGWLGRYLDSTGGGDLPGVHFGLEKQPLALAGDQVRVPSIESIQSFQLKGNQDRKALQQLATTQRATEDDLLGFVQSSTAAAVQASDRLAALAGKVTKNEKYPDSSLGRKLGQVAQLIHADLPTRIYYVELDGFDTHAKQPDAHAALLREFAEAARAFTNDMTASGDGQRVLLMAFSEFGRRVQENASSGTDHGTAGPMFFAGSGVRAGLIGAMPSLTKLHQGDLVHHTDFRQVYTSILHDWLACEAEPILGRKYTRVPLIAG